MAKLDIVIAGNPVLRQVAKPVERIDKNCNVCCVIWQKLCMQADGVGLSGPQIGVSKRIVVIDR